ncbi:MBL fold metallo-hydrolase [Methanobacterium paludis]|uniref:Zn-dependent hydrolase n=1 Tax=Methanobacterium paludis (strain DSM 25820 / JCM 18151 / SWAN1) TaxID=868131 RepID=F6D208_METPW|nr:MBL fold metallo-hydrolase [Methanobacterium paludis]AEG17297.1 Zn-dependent hydrolase [Methanobacterium paludis]
MKKWITHGNHTISQVLEGRSNSFLISKGNIHVLVDTGRINSWKNLEEKLDCILEGDRLSALVLTHTHFDHVENAAKIKEKYNPKIITHKSEAEYLGRGNTPLPAGTNFITRFIMNLGKRMQLNYNYESVACDIMVDEKYDLNPLGINAYIIYTPGHSPGSISVIVDDEIAIVGDAMFGVFGGSVFPPFADDIKVMVDSWDKLLKTGSQLFIPGHGQERSRKLLQNQFDRYKERNGF